MDDAERASGRRTGELLAGRLRLGRLLGEGGFGVVYEAVDETTGRGVAVKLLHPHLIDVREAAGRFRREAAIMSAVRHPNVVEVVDGGSSSDGTLYFAMERLEGEDLSVYLETSGPLRVSVAVAIAGETAAALSAVHAAGIVHRDLKPDNVFLVDDGNGARHVKLLDFGIAKVLEGVTDVSMATRTGTTMGTAYYMAPEQAQARKDVDARADLYALGVILFRMLSGVHPFEDSSYPLLVVKICTEPAPSILAYRADVPVGLAGLINALLAKDPDQRPQTAQEVALRLAAFRAVHDEPRMLEGPDRTAPPRALRIESPLAHAHTMLSELDPAVPPPDRGHGKVVAASLAAFVAILAIGWFVSSRPPALPPAARVTLPRPAPPIQENLFEPATNAEGYRFLNPVPRALPSFHDVAVGGPGIVAMTGRGGALFVYAAHELTRVATGTNATFYAVAWTGTEDLIVAGERGSLVAVHGATHRAIDTHVERTIRDAVVLAPREWVLVGDGGTFLRVAGERASPIDAGVEVDLLSATVHEGSIFAVGADGAIVRWDHTAVTRESSGSRRVLRAIRSCPGGDLYAVGDEGTVLHRRASGSWEPVATRSRETFAALACREGRLLAVGAQGGVLVIGGLQSVRLESGDARAFFGVDSMAGAGVWAVGAGGRLAGVGPDRVLRLTSGVTDTLFDAVPVSGVWVVVGAGGTIARAPDSGGLGFTNIASPLASGLGGIALLDADTAVAVGDLGAILAITLRGVRVLASPSEQNLRDVVARDGSLVAVGTGGVVIRGTDGAFVASVVEGERTFRSISGRPGAATAVGEHGLVARIGAIDIRQLSCGVETNLRGVHDDGHDAYAVGDGGVVVHITDVDCTVEHRGGPDLYAIGPAPGGGLLAVGQTGAALRRSPDGTFEATTIDTGGYDLYAVLADEREVLLVGAGGVVLRAPRLVVPSSR